MKKIVFLLILSASLLVSYAQKKILDHSVYDSWQSIGERSVSNDGNWVVYTVNVQEGDSELFIQSGKTGNKTSIPRGYNATITEDNQFVICRIKPFYKESKEAKIKKKKPEDSPKDSLAIIKLATAEVLKFPAVKAYKTPQKASGWVAYHLEKKAVIEKPKPAVVDPNKKVVDSLKLTIDSLLQLVNQQKTQKKKKRNEDDNEEYVFANYEDAEGDEPGAAAGAIEGTDLVLRNLETGQETVYKFVTEFFFNKNGQKLLFETSRNLKDSASIAYVLLKDIKTNRVDTLSRSGNDFKNFVLTDDGTQVAYLAERDAKPKDLQKFYRLWYFKTGMDSAQILADRNSVGMKLGMVVSENGNLSFSKNQSRLFFGTASLQAPKDTTLIEMDFPKLDIWHYNDDYLQTVQLFNLQNELRRNYLAYYDFKNKYVVQLAFQEIPQVIQTNEGDGDIFVGVTDFGKRIESQWQGSTLKDIYAIDVKEGSAKLVTKNLYGQASASSTGKYILWYDRVAKNYFAWDGDSTRNISKKIKFPLWNEDNDVPDQPQAYGLMSWSEGDMDVYVYDKFDIWKLDPLGKRNPENVLYKNSGRINKITTRYISTDPGKRFIKEGDQLLVRRFDKDSKEAGLALLTLGTNSSTLIGKMENKLFGNPQKAKNENVFIYTKESFKEPADIYVATNLQNETKLSGINPQQKDYNWGTSELVYWTAFTGKKAQGILYKPENFDATKKYPMIVYFYEELSDGLNRYIAPAPIRSAVNISFFVSRGYLVFIPDIKYTIGYPAKGAYDYIVSGSQALAKNKWVDSKNIAIQGHSWGGIQVAQLVTMTNMFKAAWSGAPVANMTSAYGAIRWESGLNRQFQYEKTQSRIGATLWEKHNLYIENSPLFKLNKVTTPMVIMANDADGAVPWYQGIEMFTALRRLGKKTWMFNYNGQGHGLTQRQDMRDYQIRMQQFFDYMLKGDKPAKWITEGVPAIKKGKDWGLDIVD